MHSARRFALGLLAVATLGCSDDDDPTGPGFGGRDGVPTGYEAAIWTVEQAQSFELTPENTLPLYVPPDSVVAPGYYVWDSWPVRNRDGSIARIDGKYVMISLTSRDTVGPSQRTPLSTWRYFVSDDGSDWQLAGEVFENSDPVGRAQWAGSMMYDESTGNVYAFYTAITGEPVTDLTGYERTIQRIGMAVGEIASTGEGVEFRNWQQHRVILEPEGDIYELPENADTVGVVYAFRDPFYYQDPQTGRDFILFTANEAGDTPLLNGVVGIAVAESNSLDNWRLLPPLIKAPGVSAQLERPHIINTNGLYYLFFSTHAFTFAESITGYEGLYGFGAATLFGEYVPLNGTGLVAANPPIVGAQSYSFLALPAAPGRTQVLSFLNFVDGRAWLTFAPTFGVTLDGYDTVISSANAGPIVGPGLAGVQSRNVRVPLTASAR